MSAQVREEGERVAPGDDQRVCRREPVVRPQSLRAERHGVRRGPSRRQRRMYPRQGARPSVRRLGLWPDDDALARVERGVPHARLVVLGTASAEINHACLLVC